MIWRLVMMTWLSTFGNVGVMGLVISYYLLINSDYSNTGKLYYELNVTIILVIVVNIWFRLWLQNYCTWFQDKLENQYLLRHIWIWYTYPWKKYLKYYYIIIFLRIHLYIHCLMWKMKFIVKDESQQGSWEFLLWMYFTWAHIFKFDKWLVSIS